MRDVPTICNTRADYDYIREQNMPGWQRQWMGMLDGRFVVDSDDLIEDDNAPIFTLGFSVAEVAGAIGFAGLTDREIEWRQSQPDRYRWEGGDWVEIPGWRQARDGVALTKAVAAKIAEIEAISAELQRANITFDGHQYYADAWATKTIESCCAVASNLGLSGTALIRVPPPLQPGYWMTADTDQGGNRVLVQLTVAKMRQLSAALYDRNGNIWGKEVIHKATIEAMVAGGAGAEQVATYDHAIGWY